MIFPSSHYSCNGLHDLDISSTDPRHCIEVEVLLRRCVQGLYDWKVPITDASDAGNRGRWLQVIAADEGC